MKVVLGAAILVTGVMPLIAQTPVRDTPVVNAPTHGTAELSVLVSSDEPSSHPLRRVSVAIQAGPIDIPWIGVTDDDGRVVFREVPAGNYLITASRPGYVRTFYGSALPGAGPGIPVTVRDGQRVADLRLRMLRGSVLTGVVRNASGAPAPNQQVQALMIRTTGGEKRALNLDGSNGTATSDDRGVYRIYGLAPGNYIVTLPLLGLTGQDMRPISAAELAWADKLGTGAAGRATTGDAGSAPPSAASVKYAPVYYPGTAVAAEASVLTLEAGEERTGIDITLQMVPTAQVRGRIVDAENRPQGGVTISLRPPEPDSLDIYSTLLQSTTRSNDDGTFMLSGVKPGRYTVSARATPRAANGATTGPADPLEAMRQTLAGAGMGGTHWATADITVEGRDVTDVMLALRPGMTMTGRIVYEATSKTPPTDLSRSGLVLVPNTSDGVAGLASSLLGATDSELKGTPDGRFTVAGIAPGQYRVNTPLALLQAMAATTGTVGGWTLKSVMANGRDIADAPIDIRAGVNVTGVVVTFTDRVSELSGTVVDGAGRPAPGFPIIVFSTDRTYWTQGSRRVQQARPASDGHYTVTGLPAGEYLVCAVTNVDRAEVYDPDFLEPLVAASFKITITDGEKHTQDLKLGG